MNVSVIIPCYNCAAYIGETLASLERQERLPDEVLCVNDGSTDDTVRIIEEFVAHSTLNVRAMSQDNAGVSAARNTGIDASAGDVLLFLDADDMYAPCFIKEVERGIEQGYDTVYGWFTHEESAMLPAGSVSTWDEPDRKTAMSDFMYRKNRCHTAAFAYRRSLLETGRIRYTVGARYGEDWEFTTKYLDNCQRILRLSAPVMFYRLNETSAMKKITYAHTEAIHAAERTEQYLLERESDCYGLFSGYMKHRAVFSVTHTFAKFRQKEMFDLLCKEYPVKESMKVVSACPEVGKKVRLAAGSFVLSPWVFYNVTGNR